jgi:hypothetical protein
MKIIIPIEEDFYLQQHDDDVDDEQCSSRV